MIPNGNVISEQEKIERILNRLTGLNRFQTLHQRTQRLNLRTDFLEQALLGLAKAQETLSEISSSSARQPLTPKDLVGVQVARGQSFICLMVLKGLISDETNAMKNRITVIPETFQKSIYYLLLRGKPVKDKNQKPHFNLSKALSAIIKLSDRFLRK